MIGGEFEIDLSLRKTAKNPLPDTYYYASGRAALYQILKSLHGEQHKIWLPDYLCHTMVEAALKAGFEYEFYELNDRFEATTKALTEKGFRDGCLVLVLNYFGLQDLAPIAENIKKNYPNCLIIEDDVQAYFSYAETMNPFADYRFTSLRKTFAIPDGGLVYTKRPMPIATQTNTFAPYKVQAGVMKMNREQEGIKDEDYLVLFEKGSDLINDNYESTMSEDAMMLFAGTDTQLVKQRRKENAAFILEDLKRMGIKPLIEVSTDKVPLFVPIYLEDRNSVRKRMFQHEIFSPVHWPLEGLPLKKGKEMVEHELSLIVDQRYGVKEMKLMLNFIK